MHSKATLRISTTTASYLNEQIAQEAHASSLYLAMGTWCQIQSYQGATTFLMQHAQEEHAHMCKLINYLGEVGVQARIPEVTGIKHDYTGLRPLFQEVYAHEHKVTTAIYKIVDHALATKDYGTFSFLQWFVQEQREEEALAQRALELFDIIGEEGVGRYTIDQALGKLAQQDAPIS